MENNTQHGDYNNDELKERQRLLSIKCPHGKSLKYTDSTKQYENTCERCDYLHTLIQARGAMGK